MAAALAQQLGSHSTGGQNHDRLDGESLPLPLPARQQGRMTSRDDGPEDDAGPVEITAVQKMLSATSGSLLTGLLMTPLDVVRVRWQSQGVPQALPATITPEYTKLAMPSANAFRPSDLGVTACCREVFFMNNTTDACVVGPRPGSISGVGVGGGSGSSSAADCAVEQTRQRTFTSTLDGLRKIARNEGFLTLWRGLSPTLAMAVPGNIIYFTGYEWLRYSSASPIQRAGIVRDEYMPLVAGSGARVLAATAVGPIELFRTRLQAAQGIPTARGGHLAQTFGSIADMVRAHGYGALWRGLTLTLWRDVPFSGMYWWGYETIRARLTGMRERARSRDDRQHRYYEHQHMGHDDRVLARRRSQSRENHAETFTDSFIAGALSGAFASVATMPFDVGKTRTQVHRDSAVTPGATAAAAAAPEERSMVRLLLHIFQTEGVSGLFRGWIPRTLKVAPACAIMISSYEVGKRAFRGVNERAHLREELGYDKHEAERGRARKRRGE